MASNHVVFGNPITDSTLAGTPEYAGKKITRKDGAQVALNMKNAEDKEVDASKFLEKWITKASTKCIVYNATGDTVTFVAKHDWNGKVGNPPYPIEIANGQWGVFLHTGSIAAAVYRGQNLVGHDCDWMLAWSNPPLKGVLCNKAYTEIREADHYKGGVWEKVYHKLENSGTKHAAEWNGCVSIVEINNGPIVIFKAVMALA